MAILLTWAVLGIAFYWLGATQSVVNSLSAEQVPRLMQTSLLSSKTANLALLSNRILYTQDADPTELENALQVSIADLKTVLNDTQISEITRQQSEELQGQLSAVIRKLGAARQIEERIRKKVDRLRWINVDIQDETAAVVADFSYNIEVLTRKLQNASAFNQRKQLAEALLLEQKAHTAFVELGNDVSISATLGIQSSASLQPEQLEQFSDLLSDALNRTNNRLLELPAKAEYVTLKQSAESLNELTVGADGLVADRKKWQALRNQLSAHLNASFDLLSDMQIQSRVLSENHRDDLNAMTNAFVDDALFTMRSLVFLTVFAALAGFAILFLYIRPSIILPMQRLTTAMGQIASGKPANLQWHSYRGDEISQLAQAVGAFRDSVIERDNAIEKLRQTQSELVQVGKMAALGTLSAGISHELSQPLGAIRQRLHLAHKAVASGEIDKANHQVNKIENMVVRMEKIIDHLRRFARRSEYRREEVDLIPVAKNAFDLFAPKMSEHEISFAFDPLLEGAVIIGDLVLLEQVLVNLISNAVDAIIETGEGGEILLRSEDAPEGMLAFSCVDTGAGLGDLKPDQVIEPFVTSKPPGEGMGLGLSISFNILSGMGGSLRLARRRGVGTRATIVMPGRLS
ncbi:ATP-binding protein [Ahrensia sp. 13_GOM-1096m]|uniref:ATP-binding protein n=1 Tax=Ahrensia sp. 13_GOM-1096m TaxID=1380380 RepID=UPI000479C6C1|nr:ATP-binding protein [Ahrensia sp. 13_GOM-1096m]